MFVYSAAAVSPSLNIDWCRMLLRWLDTHILDAGLFVKPTHGHLVTDVLVNILARVTGKSVYFEIAGNIIIEVHRLRWSALLEVFLLSCFLNCAIIVERLFTPADKVFALVTYFFLIQVEFGEVIQFTFLSNIYFSHYNSKSTPSQRHAASTQAFFHVL